MSVVISVDWKLAAALGLAAGGVILCAKMDAEAAERVLHHTVNALAELMFAGDGEQ